MDRFLTFALRAVGLLLPFIQTKEKRRWISGGIIIVSNVIPIMGVAFLQWDPAYILILYWAESAIIGFFNIFKMLMSGLLSPKCEFHVIGVFLGVFLSCFFTVHYGGFMFGHAMFIFVLFFKNQLVGGPVELVSSMLSNIISLNGFVAAFIALFVSHGYGFFAYFIRDKIYLDHEPQDFMIRPYGRIVVMHITIIIGGMIAMIMKWNLGLIIVWVALKMIVDIRLTENSRKPYQKRRANQ